MVSNDLPLRMSSRKKRKHPIEASSRKKRKHQIEDSADCVTEGEADKDSDQMDQSVESMDCISQLPDNVIHHILSLFRNTKDLVRTSVLSKRWNELWDSFSVFIFDERKFIQGIGHEDSSDKEMAFREYVSGSLNKYLNNHLTVQVHIKKLLVHMPSFKLDDAQFVDYWVQFAVLKKVKELDLQVGITNNGKYTLHQIVFISETLTGLRLSGCTLQTSMIAMLPNLQKLYLRKVHVVENIIQNLISCCHSIEDLRFIQCSGLKSLCVSNHIRLGRVEIHHCNYLKMVELCAPNLHTFWFCGKKSAPCKVSLKGCKSLKRLTLEHPQVTRDFCEKKIASFPLLEKLDLCLSDTVKKLSISNPYLQRFALKGCKNLLHAEVNAPNLVSFEFKGVQMPLIDFKPFCLTGAKLCFEAKSEHKGVRFGDVLWYFMRDFILKFDSEGFKLVIHSNKNIIIYEDLTNFTLPPMSNLTFQIIKSSTCIEDILYSLMRTLHPVSISLVSPFNSKFPEAVCEMIKIKDEDSMCCRYNTSKNKCWRHYLKDVKFEYLKDIALEEISKFEDKSTATWYNWLKIYSPSQLQSEVTNLRLHWNSDVET